MYVYKQKPERLKFNLSEFVMFSCKTRIGERSFSSITTDLLDFHANKTEFLRLDEPSRVASNSGETQTRKLLLNNYWMRLSMISWISITQLVD